MTRRFVVLSFVLVSISFHAYSQPHEVANHAARNLRAHVEYLASEKLQGRRTGENGALLASKYIANQFRKIKLRSAPGLPTNFLQDFPYVAGVEAARSGNEFRLQVGGKSTTAQAAPAGFSPDAAVADTQIVFAGLGMVSREPKRDDYAGIDVKGKIVLVFDGSAENDNPHSLLGRFDARTKALIARDQGAVGMLIISREQVIADDKLARMSFDQTMGESALPVFVISRETALRVLGTDAPVLKDLETGKAVRDAATTNTTVGFKIDLIKKISPAYNVVGMLPGTDPVLKDEAIIIGAHYDHLGRGGQGSLDVNSSEIHYGADDNASGTAAVIELARKFARERKNKRTIIFMAFSGEEEGLLGSKFYVNNPLWPLDKTIAMINLDMVGRLKDDKLNIGGIGTAVEWKTSVQATNPRKVVDTSSNQAVGMILTPTFKLQMNEDGFGPSDHSSFYGKKIPVLFFFTGTHVDYHKPSDTADKINYAGLEKITDYVAQIVRSVDRNAQRPAYTVAKSSGMGGRTGFNISLGTIPSYADSTDGLVLDGVRDNSPAAKAGIKAGDKIVKLAGKEVRNAMDYTYVLGEMKAGQEYEIVVIRGGETLSLKIIPVKR